MNLIQFIIQGALAGTTLFDPSVFGVNRVVADSRIVFTSIPALTYGRFDVASLLNLAGRPMVVYALSMSNGAGPVTGSFGTVGPTSPGGAARGVSLTVLAGGSGVRQNPVVVPSQHLLQVNADVPPVTLMLLVGQLKSGDVVNEFVRGTLTP
jgi:hypothetical protein